MSPDTPEGERNALARLLEVSESLVADFTANVDGVLGPVLREVLAESGVLLTAVVESFGWDGEQFTRQVDVRALCSRLKALLFDGLEQKGRGSYATVYKARNRLTGQFVTLKKLKLDKPEEGMPAPAIREVCLLTELDHPNIVRLLDVLWDDSRLYMILEYLDVDLHQHMDADPEASLAENVRLYMFLILQGLEYAHAQRILHRDLKPQNILVDRATNTCKIADFGLARSFVPPVRPYTHEVVTLLYRPPEILLGSSLYSTPADIWSAGCILAELATGEVIFPGDSEIGQLFQIFSKLGTPDESCWKGVTQLPDWQAHFPKWAPRDLQEVCPELDPLGVDLLKQMLAYNPNERITARRALEHPYFNGLQPYYSPGTPSPNSGRPLTGAASSSDTDLQMMSDVSAPQPTEQPTALSDFQEPMQQAMSIPSAASEWPYIDRGAPPAALPEQPPQAAHNKLHSVADDNSLARMY